MANGPIAARVAPLLIPRHRFAFPLIQPLSQFDPFARTLCRIPRHPAPRSFILSRRRHVVVESHHPSDIQLLSTQTEGISENEKHSQLLFHQFN